MYKNEGAAQSTVQLTSTGREPHKFSLLRGLSGDQILWHAV